MTAILAFTSHAGRWPRAVVVLVAARAVNRLGAFAMSFLAVTLVDVHGASLRQAGLVVGLFGVMTIPSRLIGGRLADRVGRRTTIVVGLVGCALANGIIAGSPGLATGAAGAALLGLCYEIYEPPSQALVADLVEPARRTQAYGLLGAALAVAGVGAGALAALVGRVDLRWLFVADAVTCLMAAGLVLAAVGEGGGGRSAGSPDGRLPPPSNSTGDVDVQRGTPLSGSTPRRSPWQDRRVWVMLAVGTGFATCWILSTIALPLTVSARGHDAATTGWLLLVAAVVTVAAQRLLRGTAHHPFRAIAAGLVVLAAGFATMAYADSLLLLGAATAVVAVGEVLLLGPPLALVAGLAQSSSRAGYLAAYGTCWGIAQTLGPPLATQLIGYGVAVVWLAGALLALGLVSVLPVAARAVAPSRAT